MKLYTLAVAYIVPVLFTAHIIAPDTYDWTQHTISQLAAQGYGFSWVMDMGFIGFGALVLAAALRRLLLDPVNKWTEGPLLVCGLMFLLSSIFSTRPYIAGIPHSEIEASIHGIMGTLARITVSVSMLAYAIVDTPKNRRAVHAIFFASVIILNALLEILSFAQGTAQRVLVTAVLTWLVFIDMRRSRSQRQEAPKSSV
ncbi:MAG: DUF998 domain-containing protein [Anaerolineales bacterium]|nr:DUF998 domain-containing protein [Anaerolineales bacterium]